MLESERLCFRLEFKSISPPYLVRVFNNENSPVYEMQHDKLNDDAYVIRDYESKQVLGRGTTHPESFCRSVVRFEAELNSERARVICTAFNPYCEIRLKGRKFKFKYNALRQTFDSSSITIRRQISLFQPGSMQISGLSADFDTYGIVLILGVLYPLYVSLHVPGPS